MSAERLQSILGVPAVHLFDAVASTQDIAHDRAQSGAPSGTVVLADMQRSGRGRFGREWHSAAGHGVWCTIILREIDADAIEVLSLRTGLAIAERLDAFAGEPVRLKWPNDLHLGAGKLGGILAEARWSGPSVGWVAVGVGINVVPPRDVPFAAGLRGGTDRIDVLCALIEAVRKAGARPGLLGSEELKQFQARDILTGREIVAPEPGIVRGLAASGALRVETPRGMKEVRAGTVQLAEGIA